MPNSAGETVEGSVVLQIPDPSERLGGMRADTVFKIADRLGVVAVLLCLSGWLGWRVEGFLTRVDAAIAEVAKRHHEDAAGVTSAINRLSESQIELRVAISRLAGGGAARPTVGSDRQ